jgi:hypothetical protein
MKEGYRLDPLNDPLMGLCVIVVNCTISKGMEF